MTDGQSDPFDSLRRPPGRTEPPPEFSAALMGRLRDAIAAAEDSRGVGVPPGVEDVVEVVRPDKVRNDSSDPSDDGLPVVIDALRSGSPAPRRSLVVVAAAVAAALVAVLVSSQEPRPTPDRVEAAPPSPPIGDLPPLQPIDTLGGDRLGVSGQPAVLDLTDSDLLVGYESHRVELIDLSSGVVRSSFELRTLGGYGAPAHAFGALWLPTVGLDNKSGALNRIDLATGSVERIELQHGLVYGSAASADDAGIWVLADTVPRTLEHVDAETLQVDAALAVPDRALGFQFGLGSLWVAAPGRLSRLDPVDGRVLGTVQLPTDPLDLARVDGEDLWLVGLDQSTSVLQLHRVEAASLRLEASITLTEANAIDYPGYEALAVTDDAVWVVTPDASLIQVDTATNTVVARYGGQGGGDVVVRHGALWVAVTVDEAVYRIPL